LKGEGVVSGAGGITASLADVYNIKKGKFLNDFKKVLAQIVR
jgi:hypothetical protein